jgi:hypothetical protein
MFTVDADLQPVSRRVFLDMSQRIRYQLPKLNTNILIFPTF